MSLGSNGNILSNNLTETKHKSLIMDYTLWEDGQTGSVGPFTQYSSNNSRILALDPWGKETVVWKGTGPSGAGIYFNPFSIDNTKLYRMSYWEKRVTNGTATSCRYYFGLNGYGSVNGVVNLAGSYNTNPYFYSTSAIPTYAEIHVGEWILIVGHVFPHTYSSTDKHPESGRYSLDGKFGNLTADFKWAPETTTGRSRTLAIYTPNTSDVEHYTVYPRIDICDGTEPTIEELLSGHDSRNIEIIRTIGGTRNLSLNHGSDTIYLGEIDEIGITNGLISYFPLNGDAEDYSESDLEFTTITATPSSGAGRPSYLFAAGNTIVGSSGFNFPATTTITGWGYSTNYLGFYLGSMLFSFNVGSGPDLYFTSDTVSWNLGDGIAYPFKNGGTNVSYPAVNEWVHYAIVNDEESNICTLYVNGQYYGETIWRTTEQSNKGFTIGNYYPGGTSYAWKGYIADIRVYDRVLSEIEIKRQYEITKLSGPSIKLSNNCIYLRGEIEETV